MMRKGPWPNAFWECYIQNVFSFKMFLFYFDFSITFYMEYYVVLVSGVRAKTWMSFFKKLQDFSEPLIYNYAAFLKLV